MKGSKLKNGYRAAGVMLIAGCMAATLYLSGCSTTAGTEATGKTTWNQEGAPELSKNVIFNNNRLAGNIEIVDMKSFMAGNMMMAQVSIHSRNRDTVPIQYKFAWFDVQGMEIGANSGAWKPYLVYGRETRTIQGVAPDPRAREFKLKIREPDAADN